MSIRLSFFLLVWVAVRAEIVWNGIVFDDHTVANLITVITTTNPIRSNPDTTYLRAVQRSLYRVPALRLCKKIIVFDGVQPNKPPEVAEAYSQYKENVIELTKNDPHFSNTELIFCPDWRHLAGTIKLAIQQVTTPFILIQQHDLLLKKLFDLNGLIATMMANPLIKYVHFCEGPNNELWAVDEVVEGEVFVPLCRSFGWTDRTHVASKDYYEQFVLPKCPELSAMEWTLNTLIAQGFDREGASIHSPFGSYFYGNLTDGKYILHLDARQN